MDIPQVKAYLKSVEQRTSSAQDVLGIKDFLKKTKGDLVGRNKQDEAKEIWCLEQVLNIQEGFLEAYLQMKSEVFYGAWQTLEQCELTLGFLRPHFDDPRDDYRLIFIARQVKQFQSLFPYRIFISPEILELEKKCSICGQVVSIRRFCGHEVGEIYNGEMCGREITDMEFLGAAFVESPLQKYSVPFGIDKNNKEKDGHDYELVKYLVGKLNSPFVEWAITWTKKLHPHSKFNHVERNDRCPCASGKKYKKCCLIKEGVLLRHALFRIPGMRLSEERIF